MTRAVLSAWLLDQIRPVVQPHGIGDISLASDPGNAFARVFAADDGGLLVLSYEGQDRAGDEVSPGNVIATRYAFWLMRKGSTLEAPGTDPAQPLDNVCEALETKLCGLPLPENEGLAPYVTYEATRPVTDPSGVPLAGYKITFTCKRGF